jgi:hypothetical protein
LINLSISSDKNGCLFGEYSYVSKNSPIKLNGIVSGGRRYVMELQKDKKVSGLFILHDIDGPAIGVWLGAPPNIPLPLN